MSTHVFFAWLHEGLCFLQVSGGMEVEIPEDFLLWPPHAFASCRTIANHGNSTASQATVDTRGAGIFTGGTYPVSG